VLSFGYIGIFSTNTGVVLSFFVLIRDPFLGKEIFTDISTRDIPEIITKADFQELGKPKNGMRKIKIPKKNVLFLFIISILYPREIF
jgi:hypothetical protein